MIVRKMSETKQAALIVALVFVAALAVRFGYALTKHEWHVDEGITLSLTNGNWMPGLDMAVHDEWTDGGSVHRSVFSGRIDAQERVDYGMIYEATAADVHPPLYYWLFANARKAFPARDGIPAGYLLNAMFFVISFALFAFIARRAFGMGPAFFASLAIFALSAGLASMTVLLRMYELLMLECLLFLASATPVLFPKGKKPSFVALAVSIAGLFLSTVMGMLTQYYFIFFALPVCAFALVWLLKEKRPAELLWAILAIAVAAYVAEKLFPEMRTHLTKSYRAKQSLGNLAKLDPWMRLWFTRDYLMIVSRYLVSILVPLAAVALAIVNRVRGIKRGAKDSDDKSAGWLALFAMISVFTFLVISLSAPYRTLRYLVAFFPFYALFFAAFVGKLLTARQSRVFLIATAVLVFAYGAFPFNRGNFHEDYDLGDDYYMRDDVPIILMGSGEGTWKVPLVYINIPKTKRIYSTRAMLDADVTGRLSAIARASGEEEVYALVCDYIGTAPRFEKIGYYGFYNVYRVPAR